MKSISKDIRDYIEQLAEAHGLVHHCADECHFACSLDEANNRYSTVMCYPCVCLDCGDLSLMGTTSQKLIQRTYTLFFLDHVGDSADSDAINGAFDKTESIALDFLARMDRDKIEVKTRPFLDRLDILDSSLTRIEYEKNSLFGYAVTVTARSLFVNRDCEGVWNDVPK